MTAADALREFITPHLDGWRIQFGRWTDGGNQHRYAVIKPAGGLPVELVREPQFTLLLVGAKNDIDQVPYAAAQTVIDAMLVSSGELVSMQPAEPVPSATNDGRPTAELAISTITNL